MRIWLPVIVFVSAGLTLANNSPAQEPVTVQDDPWLARRGTAEVTQTDLERYLLTVPEEYRAGIVISRKRVGEVLNGLLLNEQIAAAALAAGVQEDPAVKVELERARQRVLIQAWLQKVGIDNAVGNAEQLAYEQFLENQSQYMRPESVDVTHILVSTREREKDKAREMAQDLHRQITNGTLDFDAAVAEYSEDPSAASNQGQFTSVRRGQMVKPFEEAAFAMTETGQISPVVQTEYGFHIIRLDGRQASAPLPFEKVKNTLVKEMEDRLRIDARTDYQAQLESIPPEVNEAAIQQLMDAYQPKDIVGPGETVEPGEIIE